tara:strand:- start:381 stop:989 length:609 start_codon:yes stop_codon:yes gene_type:complete
MNHQMIFGVPMFRYHLDPSELKKIATNKYEEWSGVPINQPPPGWDCSLRTEFNACRKNEYAEYYNDIMVQFSKDIDLVHGRCNIYESWLNFYGKGENQEEHDHLPGFYSACHYIKFNPEVHQPTKFVNPLYSLYSYQYKDLDNGDPPDYRSNHWLPDVVEGDILIFPAWLRHMVTAQKNNEHRITLAFNINIIKGSARRVFA